MNENIQMIFGLFGGLALFLFGMNHMSDALQKAAGDRMRKILGFLTKNPVMGMLAGALVTAILQSSSATTVMTIGFVSAGLMTLPQAISVIFGANIGTTMTAQLIAFDISDYIYPILFIGFLIAFVAKKEQWKNVGNVIFNFGLLFEGIEIMGSVMKPLAGSPVFTQLMEQVKDIPLLGVVLGLCMTLIVQSSSATIAVLQSFASTPASDGVSSIIGIAGAIPILLGDNIGTTITALLASIGQSKNAKRTAIAHSIFNVSGSLVFIFLIKPFAAFITFISPKGNEIDVISRQIANAHTTFNIVCTLIWLPLLPIMVRIVRTIIRGEDNVEDGMTKPAFLDNSVLGQPVAALTLIRQEISRCYDIVNGLLKAAQDEVTGDKIVSPDDFNNLYKDSQALLKQTTDYISNLFATGSMTAEQSEEAAALLSVTGNMDRISDRCSEIVTTTRNINMSGQHFSKDAKEELRKCFKLSRKLFSAKETEKTNDELFTADIELKNKMRKSEKKFLKAHLERVANGKCSSKLTPAFNQILYSFDRMVDNCTSILEESKPQIADTHLG